MRIVIAGAALVLLAACSSSTTSGKPQRSGSAAVQAGVKVVCTATGSGNVADDQPVLAARAAKLGKAQATVTPSGSSVTVLVPGASVEVVHDLCDPGVLDFRPLVAPETKTEGDGSPDALTSLDFDLPKTEADYAALTAEQKTALGAALAKITCPYVSVNDVIAVCDETTPPTGAALLGAPVVSGEQVTGARATPPNSANGVTQWTVALDLSSEGQQAWAAYTAAHNTGGRTTTTDAMSCGTQSAPCGDWVGVVLDGHLLSLPVTVQQISGRTTSISGDFSEKSAKALAAGLDAGQLPVPLRLSSAVPTN